MDDSFLFSRQLERLLDSLTGASVFIRLFAFSLTWLLLWLPVAMPLGIVLGWHPCRHPTPASQKLPLVASLYAIAPVVIWGASVLENVPFTDYGLSWNRGALQSWGTGLLLGVLGLAVLFGVQWGLGWIQIRPYALAASNLAETALAKPFLNESSAPSIAAPAQQNAARFPLILLSTFAIALWISLIEELVFRGFLLNQLQRDCAPWLAVSIASLIFALLHLVWEGQETVPQLPGLWLMGIVLSIARWSDHGSLGLAIGLHTGWVWTIASLDTAQLLHYTGKAPAWLTGLGDRLLAGVFGLLFLLGTAGVLIGMRE